MVYLVIRSLLGRSGFLVVLFGCLDMCDVGFFGLVRVFAKSMYGLRSRVFGNCDR